MARTAVLTPDVLADFKRRGQSRADAVAMGIKPVAGGFEIPYFNERGKRTGFSRTRRLSGDLRYTQPEGSGVHLYFPPNVPPKTWRDARAPLLVTEGEIKSYVASKHGFPCLGLGGVWSWMQNGQPLPALARIAWKGRTVYIVFDSDAANNPNVRQAEDRLAAELRKRGAHVVIIRLPDADD